MFELRPQHININDDKAIFVVKFSSEDALSPSDLVSQLQTELYDDIGTSGHFRIAPYNQEDLTEQFILHLNINDVTTDLFFLGENDEVYIAFFIEAYDADVTIEEELGIFTEEMNLFISANNYEAEIVDIDEMYQLDEEHSYGL